MTLTKDGSFDLRLTSVDGDGDEDREDVGTLHDCSLTPSKGPDRPSPDLGEIFLNPPSVEESGRIPIVTPANNIPVFSLS